MSHNLCQKQIFRATQIKTYSWDSAQVLLVGNKADMQNERVVSTERGQELAQQLGTNFHLEPLYYLFLGFDFFECSAKENLNVSAAFDR